VAVASERERVLPLPCGAARSALRRRVAMTFAETARRLPGSSLTAKLAMLLLSLADPLDLGVSANSGVSWVDHDDFVVFVSGIVSDPVRVQHAKRSDLPANALLGDGLEGSLEFHLVDSVVSRLAISAAFGDGLLAGSAANANAVDHETLLRAITQTSGLFNTGRLGGAMDS